MSLFQEGNEFPLIVELNFSKLIEAVAEGSNEHDDHVGEVIKQYLNDPKFEKLRNGLRSADEVEKHQEEIDMLMKAVFPYPLRLNEIKAASVPWTNILFHKSERFDNILKAAGPDFELVTRNMNQDNAYIFGCSMILMSHYQYRIDFKRPFYFDIPDAEGTMRHYRIAFNGDFMEVIPTEKAIPITDEDVEILIDNYDNVEIWKEKFPPNSYIFRGFGLANMIDVTLDEAISDIKMDFISRRSDSFLNVQENVRKLFGNKNLDLGFTLYDANRKVFRSIPDPIVPSIMLGDQIESPRSDALCCYLEKELLDEHKTVAISNLDKYGDKSNHNLFYQRLTSKNYKSYICAPLLDGNRVIGILELGSTDKLFLNTINANKLDDLVPILSVVMKRAEEDHRNMLEVIIQEECTSIHPSVAWRFEQEAERYFREKMKKKEPIFSDIVFEDVYPLYGQVDIRGSSDARNLAIKQDLLEQLTAAEGVIHLAVKQQ